MGHIASLVIRRARWVLVLSALAVALSAVVGAGAFGKLQGGGFEEPGAESSRGQALLADRFGVDQANLLLLVTAEDGASVDDPAVAAAGRAVAERLAGEPGVRVLASYWSAGGPAAEGLRSRDADRALVLAHVPGTEDEADARTELLQEAYTADLGPATVATGGGLQASIDIGTQVGEDLAAAETLAIPLTLLLLVLVFGGIVAGLLPLVVGIVAILGTFASLAIIAGFTDVSIFALNLTTGLGIGLGVDYALLIVSRYREEVARGRSVADAVATTLSTAGRTVLFSAATVAVALSALLVFPLYFLRSFAYAGIAVVAVATLAALVLLPALLVVLGPRVERWSLPRRRLSAATSSRGGWARLASFVMRRPVLSAAPVLALFALMAVPLADVRFGVPDDRALRTDVQARQVGDVLRADFASQDAAALQVVLPALPEQSAGAVGSYATELSRLPGVGRVAATTGVYAAGAQVGPAAAAADASGSDATGSWLTVVPTLDPNSPEAERLVQQLRLVPAPGEALVTGPSAFLTDGKTSIGDRLWLAGLLIVVSTFVLLFLFTGSVVLPLKALLLNVVSLGAVLGAMVWVFQDGNLSGVLDFTPTALNTSMPVLLFCVAFGLSMDYEVFLLSRIKEEHDAGADTRTAVATGIERTGRIVTMAAVILSITFFAFGTSGVSFIQFFGIGTGLAIVLDATLVRGILVPATMRLLGEANWWAPAPLRRLHDRFGLAEAPAGLRAPAPVADAPAVVREPQPADA